MCLNILQGFQYQLGDFCLRIGKCVPNNSETLRGIMMEVSFHFLLLNFSCTDMSHVAGSLPFLTKYQNTNQMI